MNYLQGSRTFSLSLGGKSSVAKLHAYADADWAGENDKRRSRSGHVIYLCDSSIMWSSKLQVSPALSPTEAEYVALASAAREVLYLLYIWWQIYLQSNCRTQRHVAHEHPMKGCVEVIESVVTQQGQYGNKRRDIRGASLNKITSTCYLWLAGRFPVQIDRPLTREL
jgi:hypothetical protein